MPQSFKAQKSEPRVIIDCTELHIQRPRNLTAQVLTWLDYKQSNTVKFLVGITSQGHVCYLSKAWGSRTSNVQIMKDSGFLNHLDHGDLVMADRGFSIQHLLLERRATLVIAPAGKGQEQMPADDVARTKQVANLRIINRMKWFDIFSGTLHITLVPLINDIAIICAALCNLLEPLVEC
ncbi:hypothetical protein CAPTEDRAFT_188413 [Capitella teleta]|uniref:DDE Tnp4 domain-containing protein n=1 Tax=Capitella teleta TaxID=283909 RepID=R7VFK7_CAPTE|nr:hypothetical protein CAPTEDRAFT_188413 [Capitella teleta]|eukprot:ELU17623.1 hypothetical protein CAPTEDRAFT_188413 [Capitella teleta]